MEFRLRTRIPQPATSYGLDLSRDGRLLAASNFDQKLRVYDARSLDLLKTLHLGTSFPHAVRFSPDGQRVGSGGKALTLFDTTTWKKGVSLKGHRHEIQGAVFAPDGARAFTGSGNNYTPADWSVRAWDPSTGAELWRWKNATAVQAVAVSPDGKLVAAGDTRGHVALLDASDGSLRWQVHAGAWIYCVRFTPSGDAVVASGDDTALAVVDVADGKSRKIPIGTGGRAFALTRDGRTAIVGRGSYGDPRNVAAVDLATGAIGWTGDPLGYLPRGVALSPDESVLYVLAVGPDELVVFDRVG